MTFKLTTEDSAVWEEHYRREQGGADVGEEEQGTARGDEIRVTRSQVPARSAHKREGGGILILSTKGSPYLVESRVGSRAVPAVFSGPGKTEQLPDPAFQRSP